MLHAEHRYNFASHSDIVEGASMVIRHTPPNLPPPAGVNAASWKAFLTAISKAPDQLGLLRNDLGIDTVIKDDSVCKCSFDITVASFDFSTYGQTRLKETQVWPAREQSPCGIAAASTDGFLLDQAMGKVLGYHAGKVDDHLDDIVLALRPSSAQQTDTTQKIKAGGDLIIGGLLIPFVCVAYWLSGNSCPTNAQDLGSSIDPETFLNNIVSFGLGSSSDFTGIWHFEDVRASTQVYNVPRGMFYPDAGPNNMPGFVDVGIMVATNSLGIGVNSSSKGIANFAQYDTFPRTSDQWQSLPLGQTEFSALHDLARYGWDAYKKDPTGARNLGWPLHAIGDAVEPHHVAGTTSYGHRPFEEFAEQNMLKLLPRGKVDGQLTDSAQRDRILARAFDAWAKLKASKNVPGFIIDTATWTSDHVKAQGDWPYSDGASVLYHLPPALGGDVDLSISGYSVYIDSMRELIEEGIGRSMALLLLAAPLAKDPGQHAQCAFGTHYDGAGNCAAGAQMPCASIPNPCIANPCTPSGCLTNAVECNTDIDCCSHHCVNVGDHSECAAAAPSCVPPGGGCGAPGAPNCCSGNCVDGNCQSCLLTGLPCGPGTEGTCCGTCNTTGAGGPSAFHCVDGKP